MSTKVKVIGNEEGQVINISKNNPEFGYIRVEQIRTMFDESGFLRARKLYALIPGRVEELKMANFFTGQELNGQIVVKESLTPFNQFEPQRDLKIAGSTGIVCSVNGQPIYRRTQYTASSNAEDVLIQHDNVEELRNAYAAAKSNSGIKANESFDIEG
jgi:hypothetical protein